MHIRIGGPDASSIGALRESAAERTRATDTGGDQSEGGAAGASSGVVISLSPEARRQLAQQGGGDSDSAAAVPDQTKDASGGTDGTDQSAETKGPTKPLSPEEKQVVQKLEARDAAVHAHEAAHMAAGKGLTGGASYTYETGPDGRRYAVGGEVPVSLSPGRTPDETIQNAETVRAAALAPADPSAQDLEVAGQASQMEAQARQEKMAEQRDAVSASVGGQHDRGAGAATNAAAMPSGDPSHDSLMVFSAIKSERPQSAGGVVAHMHSSGADCAFCKQAASRYAS
ncbi:MAG TPA: putative metalloprotease CJM1_0395 family protein [Polyangia bacterium]